VNTSYTIKTFGDEAESIVIIDGFSTQFVTQRTAAEASTYVVTSPHYPGIRAQAGPSYLAPQMPLLKEMLIGVFEMPQGANLVECAYTETLQAEISQNGLPPAAYYDSGPLYERIGEVAFI
jgi:hypothetical protein